MEVKFNNQAEALAALGLSIGVTAEEVKSTYHKLMSLYHPDANDGVMEDKFYYIRDAYEYLLDTGLDELPGLSDAVNRQANVQNNRQQEAWQPDQYQTSASPQAQVRPAKILGNKSAMQAAKLKRKFAAEHAKQEDRARRRHEEERKHKLELESRYEENLKYEEAMMKIRAIRAAEVTANIYRSMMGRDG